MIRDGTIKKLHTEYHQSVARHKEEETEVETQMETIRRLEQENQVVHKKVGVPSLSLSPPPPSLSLSLCIHFKILKTLKDYYLFDETSVVLQTSFDILYLFKLLRLKENLRGKLGQCQCNTYDSIYHF